MNLKALGANPILCGVVGRDAESGILFGLLDAAGIDYSGIIQCDDRPTTVKTRVLAQKSQLLRIDTELDAPLQPDDEENFIHLLSKLLERAELVIFEDYDKGLISPRIIESIVDLCKEMKKPVVVDPKKRNFLSYTGVTLFKPNMRELAEGLKLDINAQSSIEEIETAARQLQSKLNIQRSLITLSERGVLVTDSTGSTHIRAHVRNIFDVSGAGDTVTSVAALALLATDSLPTVAALANLAGGLVCEKIGVVPLTWDELREHAIKEFCGSGVAL
jgi:rfaE bifunctional protein kinase chain/domain